MISYLDNIREKFHFDVATGDPITPREIQYKYKILVDNKEIQLWAYNLETVLAEKLESILSKNILSSRMKDYYDVYIISTIMFDKININHLKKALYRTFKKRDALNYFSNFKTNLNNIKNDHGMNIKWKAYQRKNDYAKNIMLEEIINEIEKLLSICEVQNLEPV